MLLYHIYMRRFSSGAVAADHSKIPPYYKIIPQAPGGNDDSVLSFHSPAPPLNKSPRNRHKFLHLQTGLQSNCRPRAADILSLVYKAADTLSIITSQFKNRCFDYPNRKQTKLIRIFSAKH